MALSRSSIKPARGLPLLLMELIPAAVCALAAIALIAIFRRERLARDVGEPSKTHPFFLGVYRGCALVLVLLVAYLVLMVIIAAISGPQALP